MGTYGLITRDTYFEVGGGIPCCPHGSPPVESVVDSVVVSMAHAKEIMTVIVVMI